MTKWTTGPTGQIGPTGQKCEIKYQETFIRIFQISPGFTLNEVINKINSYSLENKYEILQHQILITNNSYINGVSVLFKKI